jgi:acetyltransferase-like isoleucine patch superfamily enzyme
MMLKVKRTEIGDGSAVNIGATIMGGVTIEPGTNLWPLSLVLKEMHLTPADYVGSPAEPATVMPGSAIEMGRDLARIEARAAQETNG